MNLYDVEKMYGKEFVYNGESHKISTHCTNTLKDSVEKMYLGYNSVDNKKHPITIYISVTAFEDGSATTDDVELLEFTKKVNDDFNSRNAIFQEELKAKRIQEEEKKIQQQKESLEIKKKSEEHVKNIANSRGKKDAREKCSSLYRLFTSHSVKDVTKASKYSKLFRDVYTVSYEDEKRLMKSEKLVSQRAKNSTLEDYPGDTDELLKWMHKNLLRVDVFAPGDKINNEQEAIDVLNKRDGTNYQVKFRSGLFVAYEMFFKNPESAPKEFLTWLVSKHDYTSSNLNKRVLDTPMNVETGKMTCNSLIKELLYNKEYKFNVGVNLS